MSEQVNKITPGLSSVPSPNTSQAEAESPDLGPSNTLKDNSAFSMLLKNPGFLSWKLGAKAANSQSSITHGEGMALACMFMEAVYRNEQDLSPADLLQLTVQMTEFLPIGARPYFQGLVSRPVKKAKDQEATESLEMYLDKSSYTPSSVMAFKVHPWIPDTVADWYLSADGTGVLGSREEEQRGSVEESRKEQKKELLAEDLFELAGQMGDFLPPETKEMFGALSAKLARNSTAVGKKSVRKRNRKKKRRDPLKTMDSAETTASDAGTDGTKPDDTGESPSPQESNLPAPSQEAAPVGVTPDAAALAQSDTDTPVQPDTASSTKLDTAADETVSTTSKAESDFVDVLGNGTLLKKTMDSAETTASDAGTDGTKPDDTGESPSPQESNLPAPSQEAAPVGVTPDAAALAQSDTDTPVQPDAASSTKLDTAADETVSTTSKAESDFVDVLGNGTLLKKVEVVGTGVRPKMGERVVIDLVKHIPELNKSFPPIELNFVLLDGDVEQALDLAVSLMDLGEKAVVIAGYKYMYGEIGLEPDVPACANFKLEIFLKANHGPPDYSAMSYDARFNDAKLKKERGNFLFKRKDYSQALNSYTKSGKILDPELGCIFPDETPERLQELLEFRAVVMCNTSVAQVRVGAFDAAVKSAVEATKLKPTYGKAYYRLGQAHEKCGQIDECIKAYKVALKHGVENTKFIHGELARLTKKNKDVKQDQQQMYSKMFWGSNPPTAVSEAEQKEDVSLPSSVSSPNTSQAQCTGAQKRRDALKFSWLWKAGLGVMGAGVAGLAGIGLYKYMNH